MDVLLQFAEDPALDVKLERHGVKAFTQVLAITLDLIFHYEVNLLHIVYHFID